MKRKLLAKIRQEKKLESKEVAEAVGIASSHYTRIENGINNPSLKVACRLEKFFNIPVCTLLRRDGEDE